MAATRGTPQTGCSAANSQFQGSELVKDTMGGFFDNSSFMPHGHCYLWKPSLLALNVVSDGIIALAYYSIPLMLVFLARRRRDLPFSWLFAMFGGFILACGTTHLMEIWTIWRPDYWVSASLKAFTAVISIATAVTLIPMLPRLLALRSPADLEVLNREMALEIARRRLAEAESAVRTEELRRSNEQLATFARITSHDLREPLRSVGSFSQLLARRYRHQLDTDADEFFGHVLKGVRRMEGLLDDLLAHLNASTAPHRPQPVEVGTSLGRVMHGLRATIGRSGAHITHDVLPAVRGDLERIELLLHHLLANSLKFRREEAPRIHLGAVRDGALWRFTLRDNGIGIAPEHVADLFTVGRRFHAREQYRGNGVGLAICRRIVERHGGRIWLDGGAEAGAVFHFTLPALGGAEAEAVAA